MISKQMLFGEIVNEKKPRQKPKLLFKDSAKFLLKAWDVQDIDCLSSPQMEEAG